MIPELIDSLTRVHEKVFFLVQLYQSHCYFANFTPEFDVWHPNLVSDEGTESKDLLLNAYDNTVLTTDDVMCKIIRAIDKPEARATFLFASDHGEVLDMDKPRRGGVLTPDRVAYHVGGFGLVERQMECRASGRGGEDKVATGRTGERGLSVLHGV